jgi:hypothetical protein
MVEVKSNVKILVSNIYECQKRIMINHRFIMEIRNNGGDASRLQHENVEIQKRIEKYKKDLSSLRNLD